jgi:O-methyltransferase involved in polyketide biosynthesis
MEKIRLTQESETLFIPLYGKAQMSKEGVLILDKKAEEIVSSVDYDFSRSKTPRGVHIYMAIRAYIMDNYTNRFLRDNPNAVVLHLGCGLDSRIERITEKMGKRPRLWYDLDFPGVIAVRRQFYSQNENYRMIGSSVTDLEWLDIVESGSYPVLIIAEGLTPYLKDEEIRELFLAFKKKFQQATFIFDAYSELSVKLSQRHNPVNKLGAKIRWGLDDPRKIEAIAEGIKHVDTKYFTGRYITGKLKGFTRVWFKAIYSNPFVNNLYRIYVFQITAENIS